MVVVAGWAGGAGERMDGENTCRVFFPIPGPGPVETIVTKFEQIVSFPIRFHPRLKRKYFLREKSNHFDSCP